MKSLIRERSRSQSPAKPGVISPCGEAAHNELSNILADFNRDGVPVLQGFDIADIPEEAFAYLQWASKQQAIDEFYDWKCKYYHKIAIIIKTICYTRQKCRKNT
ncbi:unnamed protein product [Danaus chrysippus]|uniref:(African queen) hypothetical protein n=1 Tax=Danaus chrysippus TaxID=151541 RepID=A0A8J2M818_9NEOP|nr:unnamed protein product [Danaus chrysippus]